jgi:hypothetical protein
MAQARWGVDPDGWEEEIKKLIAFNREKAQHWALASGPRGWVQWTDWRDNNNERIVLKDFHVRMVNHLRQTGMVLALLPFLHGKSALASGLVPFIDWSENLECTQIRVYESDDFATNWTRTLMDIVESNERLHLLFPGISKPGRGSASAKVWSTDGFNISGREHLGPNPSFRATTWAKGRTGIRGDRIIFDDLVNDENDESVKEQDRMHNYVKSGAITMREVRPKTGIWNSRYGTKWGTLGVVGTIFDKQDVNARLQREWRGKSDRKVIRIDVFPYKGAEQEGVVIWPEKRPHEYIMQLKDEMGDRAFKMRLRNMPGGDDGTFGFDEDTVKDAVKIEWMWGQAPAGMPLIIGFDPASGKRTRWTKYPAFVVLAFSGEYIHFVCWGRWQGKTFPTQIGELAQLGLHYQCPIAIEDNATQTAYGEQLNASYSSVRTICMTTGDNKRDPASGVEMFDPLFRNGKVIMHGGSAPPDMIKALTSEFIDWPRGEYTDLVMAAWTGKRQYDLLHKFRTADVQTSPVPKYISNRGLGGSIDLRPFKQAASGGSPWKT